MLKKMRRFLILLTVFISAAVSASAAAPSAQGNAVFLGTMRVVNCKEWVSLREAPDQTTMRLAKIPLGELVYDCYKDVKGFVYCQYEGKYGYVLIKYLEAVSGAEAVHFETDDEIMSLEEIRQAGEVVLDWNEYNIRIVASHENVDNSEDIAETLRVGCFIDELPLWGYATSLGKVGEGTYLRAFMGGTEMDPAVMVYNGAKGLTRLDLLSGMEEWTLSSGRCQLGNAAAVAVGEDGTMYLAGTDGPPPVAVATDGTVLWKSVIKNTDVYDPYRIDLTTDEILVRFRSGMEDGYIQVSLQYDGKLIGIAEMEEEGRFEE